MIPACVSQNGRNYIHEKNITIKELMKIKDICKNHPSVHSRSMVPPLKCIRKPNHKKYVHLSDASYLSIINTTHPSSGIGSSKRENITEQ